MAGRSVGDISATAKNALEMQNLSTENIEQQLRGVLEKAGVRPQAIQDMQGQAQDMMQNAQDAAKRVVQDPSALQNEIKMFMNNLMNLGQKTATAADRETLVGSLMQRANMNQEEAQRLVQGWERQYNDARMKAERAAREATETVAKTVSGIAGAVFAALVIGAIAAGIGGAIGASETLPSAQVDAPVVQPVAPTAIIAPTNAALPNDVGQRLTRNLEL